MTIDLSRFRQTFLDESRENLDAMENALLALDAGRADAETINTIFRAAHSIKGGAGTFGFTEVASVTHLLETLLDQMRSGRRDATPAAVTVLLQSVDVVRSMLAAAQTGAANDAAQVAALTRSLEQILGEAPATAAAATTPDPVDARAWRIRFVPSATMLLSGNDPIRIFRELETLGTLTVDLDASRLPPLAECQPETAYLGWMLALESDAPRDRIADVFAWVEGDCELAIEPAGARPATTSNVQPIEAARAARGAASAPVPGAATAAPAGGDGSSIRVNVAKVDAMINLVGELVITQAMLKQQSGALDPVLNEKLLNGLAQLDRNTRDLQDAVMSIRMLPMDFVFSRFPRVVRDLAERLGKKVRLRTVGESTELDKGVIEKITDPLNHLVRNSLDHGVETPAERLAAGKDETGTISLRASHQGGNIVLEVSDDGRGLSRERLLAKAAERGIAIAADAGDAEVWQLIFAPGFSTAEKVTDVSGRGVGMDVVKKNILALGGSVDIASTAGHGMSVTIRLPLTLAILDGMSVAVGGEIFILPLNFVVESLQPKPEDLKSVSGQGRLVRVRGEYLPLLAMHDVFRVGATAPPVEGAILVIVEADGRKLALQVDELVGQQQVVIKNLENNYRRVPGVSGATILGDGRVALIVDVGGLARSLVRAA